MRFRRVGNYVDGFEEVTRNFKKDDTHADLQADAPLHTRKFYQTRIRNYKRRAKGATVFGNERGNIVTRGETASFATKVVF